MVHFRVRAESLTEVAALLGNVVATFDGNVSAVNSQVQNTLNGWKGDDADSFRTNWQTFMSLSESVRLALTGLQGGLVSAAAGYDTTEGGVRRSMTGNIAGVSAIRKNAVQFEAGVQRGEARAEDMAEFFGRDYAGDNEVEQFGGAVTARGAAGKNGTVRDTDTDGDGDDDSIGTGPFLSAASVDALYGEDAPDAGFAENDEGILEQTKPEAEATPTLQAERLDTEVQVEATPLQAERMETSVTFEAPVAAAGTEKGGH